MRGRGRRGQPPPLPLFPPKKQQFKPPTWRLLPSKRLHRLLLFAAVLALIPPAFFHLRLRHFHNMRMRKCGWMVSPPLVCAHGGDSSKAFPNSVEAFRIALNSHVDCIEVDVSRSSDGALFALHDRDLQRMTANSTVKVGYLSGNEIRALSTRPQLSEELHDQEVPSVEDALTLISQSVRQVILDIKIGPPFYETGLAEEVLSMVRKTRCRNCLIWAKSDTIGRNILKLSRDVMVGYIIMMDPKTGARSNSLRIKAPKVAGVYHPLIHEKLMKTLHRNGKKVYAWTVDDRDSMHRMLSERVDAIVTSNPSLLQELMGELRTECLEEGFGFP